MARDYLTFYVMSGDGDQWKRCNSWLLPTSHAVWCPWSTLRIRGNVSLYTTQKTTIPPRTYFTFLGLFLINNTYSNLQLLCMTCQRRVHGRQGRHQRVIRLRSRNTTHSNSKVLFHIITGRIASIVIRTNGITTITCICSATFWSRHNTHK